MKRWLSLMLAMALLLPLWAGAQGGPDNQVLLLGTDRLGHRVVNEEDKLSRADAIYIISAPGEGQGLRLLGIERDYLIELPEGGVNKLSTATYFGGPALALRMVNQLLELELRYYIQIDIPGTVQAVDAMGGVDVMVYEEELAVVNRSPIIVPKARVGLNHFDGKQAQAFMRVRDMALEGVTSNTQRGSRQIRVLSAMMEKVLTLGPRQAARLATQVLPLVQTNMSAYDLLGFLRKALSSDLRADALVYRKSPIGPYLQRRANLHLVVVPEDQAEEIRLVHEFLTH